LDLWYPADWSPTIRGLRIFLPWMASPSGPVLARTPFGGWAEPNHLLCPIHALR